MLINTCHLSTISKTPVGYELSGITIMSEENVKRLGIYIDNRLLVTSIHYHIQRRNGLFRWRAF